MPASANEIPRRDGESHHRGHVLALLGATVIAAALVALSETSTRSRAGPSAVRAAFAAASRMTLAAEARRVERLEMSMAEANQPTGEQSEQLRSRLDPKSLAPLSSTALEAAFLRTREKYGVGIDGVRPRDLQNPIVLRRHRDRVLRQYRSGNRPWSICVRKVVPRGAKLVVRGICTVDDAALQRAFPEALGIWEKLPPEVVGGRPGATVGRVVQQVSTAIKDPAASHILKLDLQSAFLSADPYMALKVLDGLTPYHGTVELLRRFYARQWPHFRGLIEGTPIATSLLAVITSTVVVPVLMKYTPNFWIWVDDGLGVFRSGAEARAALNEIEAAVTAAGLRLHPDKTMLAHATDKTAVREAVNVGWSFLGFVWRDGRPLPDHGRVHALIERTKDAMRVKGSAAARACVEGWAVAYLAPLPTDTDIKYLKDYDAEIRKAIPRVNLPSLMDLFVKLAVQQEAGSRRLRTPRGRKRPPREEYERWRRWEDS